MEEVERVERHGVDELRARRRDDWSFVCERVDQRMMNFDAYPRIGQLNDEWDARATEVRVHFIRDPPQREELPKRHESTILVLACQARQLARAQVAHPAR